MNKVLIASCVVALLAGCGSKPRKEEVAECTFPLTQEKAPSWVCNKEVAGYKDIGYGTSKVSAAGYQFTLDQATLFARRDLASQMSTRIAGDVKNAIQTTGAAGASNETVDALASSVARGITAEKLTGSKVVRQATDPKNTTLVVLVGMDIEASRRVVQQAVQNSFQNQSAQWQTVVGNRLQAEMQAEILKMSDSK